MSAMPPFPTKLQQARMGYLLVFTLGIGYTSGSFFSYLAAGHPAAILIGPAIMVLAVLANRSLD